MISLDLFEKNKARNGNRPPISWDEESCLLFRGELDADLLLLFHLLAEGVILEFYDAMVESISAGHPYQTCLNPPPADPSCCHPPRKEQTR